MDLFNKRAKLRSEKQRFSLHDDCFICGKNVDKDLAKRLPGNPDYQYSIVMTISLIETVAKRCEGHFNARISISLDVIRKIGHHILCSRKTQGVF